MRLNVTKYPPAPAAKAAPTTMAAARRRASEGREFWRLMAAIIPEKAPTLIKPAWPRLSSPSTPTVRFRDTAITI